MPGIAIACGKVSVELTPRPINPDWILDGNPVARGTELWRSQDGMSCTIVWECTPGQFEWHYDTDETIQVLEGAMVLDDGLGPARRLGPGDVVFFPCGSVVRWTVEEKVRKLAFFRRTLPAPVAALTRLARIVLKLVRGQPASGGLMAAAGPAIASVAAQVEAVAV